MPSTLFPEMATHHLVLLSGLLLLAFVYVRASRSRKNLPVATKKVPSAEEIFKVDPVSPDFKWDEEEPLKLYPFKDKEYKLTMAIKYITAQDWLLVDKDHRRKVEDKTLITQNNHPDYKEYWNLERSTVFESPECEEAIREFYDITIKYMCDKYPMCFSKTKDGTQVHNKIMDEMIAAQAGDIKIRTLLHYLVRTIEEDFIILLPDPTRKDEVHGTEYFFKGGVFGFPAGFDPAEKFDKPLTSIHEPVPEYEKKLKLSMNRFFAKLAPGEFVLRSNFTIQTHNKLFVYNNKGYHDLEAAMKSIPYEDLDFENQVHYRSERQALVKLPKSRAVVFTIHTYLHPLSKFKGQVEEARRLRGSLQKFPDEMALYKNLYTSRQAVTTYLDKL